MSPSFGKESEVIENMEISDSKTCPRLLYSSDYFAPQNVLSSKLRTFYIGLACALVGLFIAKMSTAMTITTWIPSESNDTPSLYL